MFLPQRSLRTFLAILFFACFAMCQDLENRRAVTEHQLLHDKGRAAQGLKRLRWLQHALAAVHTASTASPGPNASWGAHKGQDPSDLNSNDGDEAASLMKQ
ncbi:PTH4 protein, partial [Donacobius atricapilla]|nr:PTH4 protein [Donacobius atricapilla]